jgi:hypothetical protein
LVEERAESTEKTIYEQNGTGSSGPNWKIVTGDTDENTQIGSEEKAVVCEELRDNVKEMLQV